MASAQITLRGRFKPGTEVRLVKVDSEAALRAEGGEEVATERVDDDGCVSFSRGVKEGERYFIVGQVDGTHLEVRARGRSVDDPDSVQGQAPPAPAVTRYADGSLVSDEPDERDLPVLEAAPDLSQQQVKAGVRQRSDTPRGTAHPVEDEEQAPYPRQDQLEGRGKVRQLADDGEDVGIGQATPSDVGPQRQQDVPKGTPQRSSTPAGGVATVIPSPPVEAQQAKESTEAKVKRGERGKAAAYPVGGDEISGASEKDSAARHSETVEDFKKGAAEPRAATGPTSEVDDASGRDAQGQPADEGVARAAGVEPAEKPAEAKSRGRSEKKK